MKSALPHVAAYWISDAFHEATWKFVSCMIAVGMTYRESLAIVATTFLIIPVVISANGAIGVLYHSPFPIYNGSKFVTVMVTNVWPSIKTNELISFCVFSVVQFPFFFPVAWITIFIWAFKSTGIGRYLTRNHQSMATKFSCCLFSFTFIAFIGVASSSAGNNVYPLEEIPGDHNCFGAPTFALASLGVYISANFLSAANDSAGLAPQYLNIRRSLIPCTQPNGIYKHSEWRVNWCAWISFGVGIASSLPGLINSVRIPVDVGVGACPYQFSGLLGFFSTTILYIIWSYAFTCLYNRFHVPASARIVREA
ncbi:hypothetical protein BGW36DRAFT_399398 [Talaromyces proteolyticus]|uniref:Uncharacterized protein n=1 Tax=Talaromyces proteolyticus TaxID=1131652 RepID=A0AAD4PY63_9EURO|nr:uncharacterized protein BGW36DRAFT_399398 [Talaromyces proteolyticus]KAH8694300.1 hypothetical protein BGW36DRAFT_399398 [Talaromyces proteolyticus]